ncbi:hypothetical protein EXS66_01180 [Candidatus Saccharibacteria bacterium]|nr:hypothetical protein [Candidatus Saccharibacteria bacterium]
MKNIVKKSFITALLLALLIMPIQAVASDVDQPRYSSKRHSDTTIHIKFAEDNEVSLTNGQFVSDVGADMHQVNAKFNSLKIAKKTRLFTASPESITAQRTNLKKKVGGANVPNLNNYFRIELNANEDIDSALALIKELPGVSEAYAEPLAAPPPISPDYSPSQTHFNAAPQGMEIAAASNYPGALGDRTKIADLEYSWNTSHEDLIDSRQADTKITNGTAKDPFSDTNHGTAAIGLFNGDRNGYGVNGIIPNAKLHLVNTSSTERGWDVANAISVAQTKLVGGDVILIEQQAYGPTGHGYVPVEWIPAVYDAIKIATQSGINVIEPAANGSENLDDTIYGTSFPSGKPDSGAIIIGAGAACGGTSIHSRMSFSNYGRRVNVQGYGECVTTSGYGVLNNIAGQNAWYTNSYNGTSSASALVAAVVGSLSSAYEYQNNSVLTPLQIRNLLIQTGTAQSTSTNPGNIGPLPNLNAAILSFFIGSTPDTTAPTAPTNLVASLKTQTSAALSWKASTDNSGQVTYKVYRNNVLVATTTNLNWTDIGLARKTSYTYKVLAVDPTGNVSASSNTVSIQTR